MPLDAGTTIALRYHGRDMNAPTMSDAAAMTVSWPTSTPD